MKLIKCFLLNNLLIVNGLINNYKPNIYISNKNIKKIYFDNGLYFDIYNDIKISNTKYNNYKSLTLEHIFPQSFTKKYKSANKDMHNIFLTSSYTNEHRSNYKFYDENLYNNYQSKNIININNNNYKDSINRIFIPNIISRGAIARSVAYMKYVYPNIYNDYVLDDELLVYWNNMYPPLEIEYYRNILIKKIQGNYNPFISNYKIL